jgi:SAM-dependent methyltransferase
VSAGAVATRAEPRAVAVEHTLAFLAPYLAAGARWLEVGSGDGLLAAALGERGVRVTALDRDPEPIEQARARGVNAVAGDFLSYEDEPFDVLLFARVLHHLDSLERAVERAFALVRPGGLVIAEEFAVERMDVGGASWYFETMAQLEAEELIPPAKPRATEITDPLERWHGRHLEHAPIHEGQAMLAALGHGFEILDESATAYLYRYPCGRLEASERGVRVSRRLFEQESRGIDEGSLPAIGLRIVGRRAR